MHAASPLRADAQNLTVDVVARRRAENVVGHRRHSTLSRDVVSAVDCAGPNVIHCH